MYYFRTKTSTMTKLFIPNLLEFIYDCFRSRTKEFMFERLEREELKKVKNPSKIKIFADKENIEQKLLLLSKLNFGVCLIIWDKEKLKTSIVHDALIAYLETDPKDITKQIINDKIFATSSTDMIKATQVMSKISHSKVYSVNREFLTISKTREHLKTRTLTNKLEADDNFKWLVNVMDKCFELEPYLEKFKITLVQFRILLFLQNLPNGATLNSLIAKIGNKRLGAQLNGMYKMNMITYDLQNKDIVLIDTMGMICIEQVIANFK